MKEIINSLKKVILKNDLTVKASNGSLMGAKGILFHDREDFKYAIIPTSKGITVHSMPMYCNQALHAKFKKLFKGTSFGKGCIKFKATQEIDAGLFELFIKACAKLA